MGFSQVYSQKLKILPLGDSITRDTFSANPRPDSVLTGYRQPLWLLLKSENYPVDFIGSDSSGYGSVPAFDPDNAGFGGYSTQQLLNLVMTGIDANGHVITPGPYLNSYHPNVILLHIGTNDLDTSTAVLEKLLNYFDDFEDTTNSVIWIILAKIINEVPYNPITSIYNDNIGKMAEKRISNGDHIKIVDMEKDAGIVYRIDTVAPYVNGDLYDGIHPNNSGYAKMASLFYDTLSVLLNHIIPVELTNFSYVVSGDSVTLDWQTALELNNYGFVIERSSNNNIWENIGFVTGADNSYSIKQYQYTDIPLQPNIYSYRLRQIEYNGDSKYIAQLNVRINKTTSVLNPESGTPKEFILEQNYPNPFNPVTSIRFTIPKESRVNISIYNSLGERITTLIDKTLSPGIYDKIWNAAAYASGAYFYVMNISSMDGTSQMHLSKKMILLK